MDETLLRIDKPDGYNRNGAPYWIKRNGRKAYSWSEWAKDYRKQFNKFYITITL